LNSNDDYNTRFPAVRAVEIAAFRLSCLRKITCGKRGFGVAAALLLRGNRSQRFVGNPTP
jgi:hypothetical protein